MSASAAAPKRFKIGIVCEGQRGCAEVQVFPHLIKLICPDADKPDIVPSGSRPNVLKNAPAAARNLLATGCDVVFVVWDVFPEWRDQGGSTDCKEHRKTLDDNMKAANIIGRPVLAVAIHEELEAWLLCDAGALTSVIVPVKNKPIAHEKSPDQVSNPEVALKKLFRRGRGKSYNESFHPGQIARNLKSTSRLRRSQSFARFEDALRELCGDEE